MNCCGGILSSLKKDYSNELTISNASARARFILSYPARSGSRLEDEQQREDAHTGELYDRWGRPDIQRKPGLLHLSDDTADDGGHIQLPAGGHRTSHISFSRLSGTTGARQHMRSSFPLYVQSFPDSSRARYNHCALGRHEHGAGDDTNEHVFQQSLNNYCNGIDGSQHLPERPIGSPSAPGGRRSVAKID